MDVSGFGSPNSFASDLVEQRKIQALGIQFMRMDLKYSSPGDPSSKIICGGNGCDTRWTGDEWVQAIQAVGAEPLIIVPYAAADAANLVKHFNQETRHDVRYWVVGNEPDQSGLSVEQYSGLFNRDYDAMKAVDPTIQIGGGATAWYDEPFLETFLRQSGSRVDFVDFHGYAQKGDVAGDYPALFQNAAGYGASIASLRSLIRTVAPDRAAEISIEVGEWELNWDGSTQNHTNFHAVWTASVLGHILSAGGRSLFFAVKGNAIYGQPHTITDPSGRVVHIQVDDTNPAYHGIGMFTGEGLFQGFGNTLVQASTTLPDIEVYASDHPKTIAVINKDPTISRTATVHLGGGTSSTVEAWRKDESVLFPDPPKNLGKFSLHQATFTYQFPPFSVTSFAVTPAMASAPEAFQDPTIDAESNHGPLLLWLASRDAAFFGHERKKPLSEK
jgi:hypothetical protein